jgi:ABC-2 type transport system ATP-binding protein
MRPDPSTALEALGLSKRFWPNKWAIRDLSLAIPRGGIVGLVGPNGAGKSTLLRTWVGFEKPTAGSAYVLGIDPWSQRQSALSRTAFLAQRPSFYRDLSVKDHLDFVAHYRGRSFDRQSAVLHLSDFDVPLTAKAGTLSGGQAAQLGLAIALGLNAEVLLLDEPLAALDPLARREFIGRLVSETSTRGSTAVLSSHIVSDIAQACDRLVVLSVGRVQAQGPVKDLLEGHFVSSQSRGDQADLVSGLPTGGFLYRGPIPQQAEVRPPTLDDLVLAYLTAGKAARS